MQPGILQPSVTTPSEHSKHTVTMFPEHNQPPDSLVPAPATITTGTYSSIIYFFKFSIYRLIISPFENNCVIINFLKRIQTDFLSIENVYI